MCGRRPGFTRGGHRVGLFGTRRLNRGGKPGDQKNLDGRRCTQIQLAVGLAASIRTFRQLS